MIGLIIIWTFIKQTTFVQVKITLLDIASIQVKELEKILTNNRLVKFMAQFHISMAAFLFNQIILGGEENIIVV